MKRLKLEKVSSKTAGKQHTMSFKKGDPKPINSGRKPGVMNKKSVLIRDILESHGINLVEQIIVRLKDISKEDQVKALVSLLPYVYPKLTCTEIMGSSEGFRIVVEDYSVKK